MSPGDSLPKGWKPQLFPKIPTPTDYSVVADSKGRSVLRAVSQAGASGIRYQLKPESAAGAILAWSWKVEQLIEASTLDTKAGDDHAVRLCAFFKAEKDKGLLLRKREPFLALVYIWAGEADLETIVTSPYSENFKKIVVESGPLHIGEWRQYERDLQADFTRAYGRAPGDLGALMLMTDTDNTNSSVVAYYGDIELRESNTQLRSDT